MRHWFALCLLQHNEKEINFSIVLWINVEIGSLFTSLDISSAWLLRWHAITFTASSFLHRNSAKSTSTRRKKTSVHHHCGLYLPWNFEKQMVPCRTVMQLARKLRTDSPGTGKLNQICTACNGHKICVYSNRAIYIVHEVNPGLKFATTIVRWTLLQSVGPILVTLSLQCPRTLGLGLGWRVVGWHMLC